MTWTGYSEQGRGSQERGPSTYTAEPGASPQARSADAGQQVRMQRPTSTPAPTINVGMPSGRPDPTLSAMLQLGQEALQKDIERRREEAFLTGMVQAASGQALTEIVANQPWYSRIFGPSAAVEGARAYSSQAAVARWVAEQQNNMNELRALSPDEIPGRLMENMDSFMTGDSQTDTMIRAEFAKQLPGLIREHTKQHYLYNQELAAGARREAFEATANLVQNLYANSLGDMTDADYQAAEQQLLAIVTPPPGVTLEAHYREVGQTLVAQARAGHFHPIRVLDELGVIQQLPQEIQNQIVAGLSARAPKALSEASASMTEEIVEFNRRVAEGRFDTDEDVFAEMRRLNDKAAGLSGVPQGIAQLFGPDRFPQAALNAANNRMRGAASAQREAETATRLATLTNEEGTGVLDRWRDAGRVMSVTLAQIESWTGATAAEINRAANSMILSLDPIERGQFLNAFANNTFDAGKDILRSMYAEATGPNATWERNGAAWTNLVTTFNQMSPDTRGRYLPAATIRKLEAYESALASGRNPEIAFTELNTIVANLQERIPADPRGENQEAVRTLVDSKFRTFGQFLTGTRMPETERGDLEALVLAELGRQQSLLPDPEGRAEQAFGSLVGQGVVDLNGGRLILNANPEQARQRPVTSLPGIPNAPDLVYRTLHEEVAKVARAMGGDPGSVRVIRMPDSGSGPIVWQVQTFKDGQVIDGQFTSDQLRERLQLVGRPGQHRGGLRGPTAARPYVPDN